MALLHAARQHAQPQRGLTVRELAGKACVGLDAATQTVKNMVRAGALRPVGTRQVDYRNRPVVEYAPAEVAGADCGHVDLARVLTVWVASRPMRRTLQAAGGGDAGLTNGGAA
ncbi:MAG: hypothetical protein ACK40S_01560 [Burkholderiaceae bacterium]